jgi:transposase-like protein
MGSQVLVSLFTPFRRVRRLVALDETVLKVRGLDSCEGKPVIVVDRGPWYRWALDRLGITYLHETFGERNRIERWFREMKDRTKRFYNNINAKTLKCLEELVTAIAAMHNIIRAAGGGEVIPT